MRCLALASHFRVSANHDIQSLVRRAFTIADNVYVRSLGAELARCWAGRRRLSVVLDIATK